MNIAYQKRCATATTLGLIALAAYLQASAVAALCRAKLSDAADVADLSRTPGSTWADIGDIDHARSARPLLDHNPFDSSTPRPLDAPRGSPPEATCPGLKATMIAAFDGAPSWSLATVVGATESIPKLVRVGDQVFGRMVRSVEWNRVVLAKEGGSCELQMFKVGTPSIASAPSSLPRASAPTDDITKGIERASATETHVDRSTVERILANPFELLKSTRIVPEQRDGAVLGIRLFGIRPESLLGAIGLENGDLLESINGADVGTYEQMMSAYGRLRSLDHLTVRLNRAGRTTNLDLDVR